MFQVFSFLFPFFLQTPKGHQLCCSNTFLPISALCLVWPWNGQFSWPTVGLCAFKHLPNFCWSYKISCKIWIFSFGALFEPAPPSSLGKCRLDSFTDHQWKARNRKKKLSERQRKQQWRQDAEARACKSAFWTASFWITLDQKNTQGSWKRGSGWTEVPGTLYGWDLMTWAVGRLLAWWLV